MGRWEPGACEPPRGATCPRGTFRHQSFESQPPRDSCEPGAHRGRLGIPPHASWRAGRRAASAPQKQPRTHAVTLSWLTRKKRSLMSRGREDARPGRLWARCNSRELSLGVPVHLSGHTLAREQICVPARACDGDVPPTPLRPTPETRDAWLRPRVARIVRVWWSDLFEAMELRLATACPRLSSLAQSTS